MTGKKKRARNFTLDEKIKLLQLIRKHRDSILNKKTDAITNSIKNDSWNQLTDTYNEDSTEFRTKESLLKSWEKIKSDWKVYYTSQHYCTNVQTDPNCNPLFEQVTDIMGYGPEGITEECLQDIKTIPIEMQDVEVTIENVDNSLDAFPESSKNLSTPTLFAKKRKKSQNNDRNDVSSSKCDKDTEELKKQILQEELEHKRELHSLRIESAKLEIDIKRKIMALLDDGALNIKNLLNS